MNKPKGSKRPVGDKDRVKHELLSHPSPSSGSSIADAAVVKDLDVFFLSNPDGSVPDEPGHGLGIYYRDCRYLNHYELLIAGEKPASLGFSAGAGYLARFQLTNPPLTLPGGGRLERNRLGIRWERFIDSSQKTVQEAFCFTNFAQKNLVLPLRFSFGARFEDIYWVRGLLPPEFGRHEEPRWLQNHLLFSYEGRDGVQRRLSVTFSPKPRGHDGTFVEYDLGLKKGGEEKLFLTFHLEEGKSLRPRRGAVLNERQRQARERNISKNCERWVCQETNFHTDSIAFNAVLDRSLRDLGMLRNKLHQCQYFSAGLPWFGTLFGRDSIITAIQILAFNPGMARDVLRLLSRYQGQKEDPWSEEQPGKILHVLRVSELANRRRIPHQPFYGTVDATPLFLVLLSRYVAWTGDIRILEELRGPIDLALQWTHTCGDTDGDGYADYDSIIGDTIANYGWKDSGDAIIDSSGRIATPPIALVEVQAYIYMALSSLADLYEHLQDGKASQDLRERAARLKKRFNKDFWMPRQKYFLLGFGAHRRRLEVISSNPGHALWAGAVEDDKIEPLVRRLMAEDMYSGWGIRTLSTSEKGYSPFSYHRGTVWPHDNAIIAAGLKRRGYRREALQVFTGIFEASLHFDDFRLPELFCGFSRQDFLEPVRYPVACHPQAWAAGSIPFLLQTILGLEPDALKRQLRVVQPDLPYFVDRLEIRGLKVADAEVHLKFERTSSDMIGFKVVKTSKPLEVILRD